MRLLTSTDLALRVLMRLSAAPDEHLSTDMLARELAVSRNHLHKIVQYLTEAGLAHPLKFGVRKFGVRVRTCAPTTPTRCD